MSFVFSTFAASFSFGYADRALVAKHTAMPIVPLWLRRIENKMGK